MKIEIEKCPDGRLKMKITTSDNEELEKALEESIKLCMHACACASSENRYRIDQLLKANEKKRITKDKSSEKKERKENIFYIN